MIDSPQVVQTDAQLTAFIHLKIPRSEIAQVMGPGIQELMATLAAQGIKPTGPWFSHHRKMESATFDFEISVPIATPVTAKGRVQSGHLPAMKVARTIYHGPYEGLGSAWGEFCAWITANGLKPADNLWECYLAGPETGPDSSKWQTQLNKPLVG
ncbi:MAG: GyrI-like domain-containing protein [Gemmatales bacterium]